MDDPNTLDYLNTLSGYVAIVISAVASYFGIAGYRKAAALKKLDLRVEIRQNYSLVNDQLKRATALLPAAKKSRYASLSADGLFRSGGKVTFDRDWEEWRQSESGIRGTLPNTLPDLGIMSEQKLEAELGNFQDLAIRTQRLLSDLEESLALDANKTEQRITLRHSK